MNHRVMSNQTKGRFSIFFMSLVFYLMITTKYTKPMGDYILEFIGLKAWSNNDSGLHLTVVYFGILFFICFLLVEKYAIDKLNIRGRYIFLIFVALVAIFYSVTGIVVKYIKQNSHGLYAIGSDMSDSSIHYTSKDSKLKEYEVRFQLTNYSEEEQLFTVRIYRDFYKEEGIDEIRFHTFDGDEVTFHLNPKESKTFSFSQEDYNAYGGIQNGNESGTIECMWLTDDKGETVVLNSKNSYLIEKKDR